MLKKLHLKINSSYSDIKVPEDPGEKFLTTVQSLHSLILLKENKIQRGEAKISNEVALTVLLCDIIRCFIMSNFVSWANSHIKYGMCPMTTVVNNHNKTIIVTI